MSCMIFGTTGLCGKAFLETAEKSSCFSAITSITRRPINSTSQKIKEIVEEDTDKYVNIINDEKPSIVFSGLATTRGAAGSAKAFVDIDHGINLKIAQASKDAGVNTFIIVSSVGASALSPFLYFKTKGRLEDDIIALKFPRTIILRPGPLIGQREASKGFGNDLSSAVFKHIHGTFLGRNIFYPIKASEVASAAVSLIQTPPQESSEPQVMIVGGRELLDVALSQN
ncbi:hypothetical protein METBIDRAFT_77230 [Metschnikowia bicuspidata var. bicuspidata NRRL YB-4993]|uniref:NAD(P)-binding domain-containing protein n=1 Tax=Metschnikowia bicuspidata var. bicuspidata NRRL YB-4993 TaxID=869754 RepID=A0A1A0HK92_9ASCO|nr:hypothetical protein METBIDRAFT_77230 [Metschnikowia bicuspidata var. bicuspidata NRRL YB-4993]OBA24440.1 hypothetical protein METBIDRAFT_77230 [Metschnikowia bicuspidata var. bicuspidata NRRL YB-4993]